MANRMSASLEFIAELLCRGKGIVIRPKTTIVAALLMDEAHGDAVLRKGVPGDEGRDLRLGVTALGKLFVAFVANVPLALIAGTHDLLQRPRHSGMGWTVSDLIGMRTRTNPKEGLLNPAYTPCGANWGHSAT